MKLSQYIFDRKSVRTYDPNKKIEADKLNTFNEFIKDIKNPYDIPVEFKVFDKEENGLSSPVVVGEEAYVMATVPKVKHAEEAYGYSFELMMLCARSLGIGTVMIGGTMKRELFENAVKLKEGQMMPCVTPIGIPAAKKAVKDTLMRTGIKADSRKEASKLFFQDRFDNPMADVSDELKLALEQVRWAPSAVNKQPWRIVRQGNVYHFYEKRDGGYTNPSTGDLQKIDLGIAICHFMTSLKDHEIDTKLIIEDPGIESAVDTEYIASIMVQ